MGMFSNHLKKVLEYTWINSIMFKSSVEKSPSSSTFVSCDHLHVSDVEMGRIPVEHPSCSNTAHQSTNSFPGSCQSVSSSSFRRTITMEETDWVVITLATSILNPLPPVSSPMADHSASSSNQAASNSSSSSISTTTAPTPLCSSSYRTPTPCSSNHDIDQSTSTANVASLSSSSSSASSSSSYHMDDSISMATSPSSFTYSPSLVSSSLSTANHSASSNQAAFNSSSSSLLPLRSSSNHNHDIDQSTSLAFSANVASLSSSSSSYHMDDSISTATSTSPTSFSSSSSSLSCSSSLSSSSSSNHAPTSTLSSQSLPSTISNRASSTRRARISSHAIFIMHSSFKWHEILLAISFTVPVGLLSATFERHKGVLVPAKLFNSNPNLFLIFIILDALAFTASVIGILLQALGKKRNKSCLSYLSLIAFTALVFAFSIYLSVLLPNFLGFIPWTLLIGILLVLLYVGVSMYNRNCYRDRVKSNTLVASTAGKQEAQHRESNVFS